MIEGQMMKFYKSALDQNNKGILQFYSTYIVITSILNNGKMGLVTFLYRCIRLWNECDGKMEETVAIIINDGNGSKIWKMIKEVEGDRSEEVNGTDEEIIFWRLTKKRNQRKFKKRINKIWYNMKHEILLSRKDV